MHELNSNFLVLFGYPGAGKSFVGEFMAKEFGYHFVEGDDFLSPAMLAALANQETITNEIRVDNSLFMIARLKEITQEYSQIVFAQALVKEFSRQILFSQFPHAVLCWIETEETIHRQRLENRKNHVLTTEMALKIKDQFDPPTLIHHVIRNNGGVDHLRSQIVSLLLAQKTA